MIGKSATSSNILCKTHNNQLSDIDSEAGKMKTAIKEIQICLANPDPMEDIERYPKIVNGLLLERWCLKTLINCLVVNNSYKPSWDIVEITFGIRPLDIPSIKFIAYLFKYVARSGTRTRTGLLPRDFKSLLPLSLPTSAK